MESKQARMGVAHREYLTLQHTYTSLANRQEPISIYAIPIPFIANHIFNITTNSQSIHSNVRSLLANSTVENNVQVETRQEEEDEGFDIGQKQESNDVVKLSLKGMKSLANVKSLVNVKSFASNYLTNFMSKKK